MGSRRKIGVVMFQLGGPDSLEAVEPFLFNLFCDPDIIPLGSLGALIRKPLARYISRRRSKDVACHYAEIGGRSPIRLLTERQAEKLEAALQAYVEPRVFLAMRYWHPLTAEAARQVSRASLDELVLLPLYPQYSFATTQSSLKEWDRVCRHWGTPVPQHVVKDFHDHPLYVEAVVEKIAASLQRMDHPADVHLVFSAHGLPMSLIERGDPYQRQVEETVRLVRERGRWPNPHILCYQSKVGRQKWLAPSLNGTIQDLAGAGCKRMLVIPLAFVTEHVETLHEINIEARQEAMKLGVEQFRMMPAVGDSSRFIAALADLVLRAVGIDTALAAPVG